MFFSWFSETSSQTTGQIRPKVGNMIAPKFPKTLQKTSLPYVFQFWLFFRSKMAKIAKMTLKIQWMIQKNFYTEIFLKMIQNGPIRKVFTIKVIFDNFFIFCPAVGHPGSTLRKISEDFFKKLFWSFYQDWCIRSTSYCILRMFLNLKTHSDKFNPRKVALHTFL